MFKEEINFELSKLKSKAILAVRERDERIIEIQNAMKAQQAALESSIVKSKNLEQVFDDMQRQVTLARKQLYCIVSLY